MTGYRIYLMRPDGHIAKAVELECEDDLAAVAEAGRQSCPHGLEIWECARQVAVIPPGAVPEETPLAAARAGGVGRRALRLGWGLGLTQPRRTT